jgi:SAM-dependent methyltransferase
MTDSVPQIPPRRSWGSRLKAAVKLGLVPLTLLLRRRKWAAYLACEPQPKLHVGCGSHILPGWLNTDLSILNRHGIVYLNARRKLPFPNESFQFIFNEHFISCLSLEEALQFLVECHRVLRPGGVLRTSTLDLAFLARLWTSADVGGQEYVRWATDSFIHGPYYSPCLVINNLFYGFGHKFIYDPACLAWALS